MIPQDVRDLGAASPSAGTTVAPLGTRGLPDDAWISSPVYRRRARGAVSPRWFASSLPESGRGPSSREGPPETTAAGTRSDPDRFLEDLMAAIRRLEASNEQLRTVTQHHEQLVSKTIDVTKGNELTLHLSKDTSQNPTATPVQ